MRTTLSSGKLFASGFMLLVITNIAVLSGVAYNRSGDPDARITLSERELKLPYRFYRENSGLALRLVWRVLGSNEDEISYSNWSSPAWLDAEKLQELGFDTDLLLSTEKGFNRQKESISKEVFIVLEKSGDSYKESLARAQRALEKQEKALELNKNDKNLKSKVEDAQKRLQRERIEESRLFAIDAGVDKENLRARYGDQTKFIITKAIIRPGYHYRDKNSAITGYISRLSVGSIHVSLKYLKSFDALLAQQHSSKDTTNAPRYEVDIAYGRRLEPWILSVRNLR